MSQRTSVPLDKIDPAWAWEPWQPSPENPWNVKWAGHLYRRAGFGATWTQLQTAVSNGLPDTLNVLIKGEFSSDAELLKYEEAFFKEPEFKDGGAFGLQAWWLWVLSKNLHPLREKMALFWHNHFVSSVAKVQNAMAMFNQNRAFQWRGLGSFRGLLHAMNKDAALLTYLDSNSNIKGNPNENYARELMELFTLGVGHYTEKDIQEAARAFTGWHVRGAEFFFNRALHDGGEKNVLGQRGNWDGEAIARIMLEQKAVAPFLIGKLFRVFISEKEDPPARLLEPLCVHFRRTDYNLRALLKTILHSRLFFSEHAFRQRIKSPAEFIFGAIWAMSFDNFVVPHKPLVRLMEAMGQTMFAPPNVKGWPGGKTWLNTSTVLARHNFAQVASSGRWPENTPNGSFLETTADDVPIGSSSPAKVIEDTESPVNPQCDPAAFIRSEECEVPRAIVDRLLDLLLQGTIRVKAYDRLVAFVKEAKASDESIRAATHAIMTMPEYQLA